MIFLSCRGVRTRNSSAGVDVFVCVVRVATPRVGIIALSAREYRCASRPDLGMSAFQAVMLSELTCNVLRF